MGACLEKPLKLNGGFPGDTLHQIKNGALPRELRKKDGGLPREARKKMETCLPIKVGEPFAPFGLCTDALALLLGEKDMLYRSLQQISNNPPHICDIVIYNTF